MSKIARVVDVTGCTSVGAMLEKSATDWDAVSSDAGGGFVRLSRPDMVSEESPQGLPLAYVGGRFRGGNHRAQLYSLEDMVQSGQLQPHSVAVWDNGAVLCHQFKVTALDVCIHGADRISQMLTMIHAYGSQVADSAFFAGFRMFCKNQFGAMASLNKESRVKHRGDNVGKYSDILSARIGEIGGELSGQYASMRRMTMAPIQGRELGAYFAEVIGATSEDLDTVRTKPREELRGKAGQIAEIVDCYRVDDGGAPGTVWQAYNAVTRYETHHDGRTEASRTRRMLMGAGNTVAHQAFNVAARLAA